MKKDKVVLHVFTIIGGGIFVGSWAWEWKNFIKGIRRYRNKRR
jgi:cytochrome c oxidase subunit 3